MSVWVWLFDKNTSKAGQSLGFPPKSLQLLKFLILHVMFERVFLNFKSYYFFEKETCPLSFKQVWLKFLHCILRQYSVYQLLKLLLCIRKIVCKNLRLTKQNVAQKMA